MYQMCYNLRYDWFSSLVENGSNFHFEEKETENGNCKAHLIIFQYQFPCYNGQHRAGMEVHARRRKGGKSVWSWRDINSVERRMETVQYASLHPHNLY